MRRGSSWLVRLPERLDPSRVLGLMCRRGDATGTSRRGRSHRVASPAVAGAWRSELSGTEIDGDADERADVRVDVDPVVPVERVDLEVVERLAASDVRLRRQSGDVDLSAVRVHVDAVSLVGAVHR